MSTTNLPESIVIETPQAFAICKYMRVNPCFKKILSLLVIKMFTSSLSVLEVFFFPPHVSPEATSTQKPKDESTEGNT